MSEDLASKLGRAGGSDGLVTILLCLFGLSIVADAIHQTHINEFYGSDAL